MPLCFALSWLIVALLQVHNGVREVLLCDLRVVLAHELHDVAVRLVWGQLAILAEPVDDYHVGEGATLTPLTMESRILASA